MTFAIKVQLSDTAPGVLALGPQKTMYGGKGVVIGDAIFIFASENQGGRGLCLRGVVTSAERVAKKSGLARQTPRVRVTIRAEARARRPLGRDELKHFSQWEDGRPETELNFKLYRQATNKLVGISEETAAFLNGLF